MFGGNPQSQQPKQDQNSYAVVPYKPPAQTLFQSAGQTTDSKTGSLLGHRNNVSGAQISGMYQPKKSTFGGPSSADTGLAQTAGSGGSSLFGQKTNLTAPTFQKSSSLFGGSAVTATGSNLYSAQHQQPQQIGQQTSSLYGNNQQPGQQQPQNFGQQTTQQNSSGQSSLFGGQQPQLAKTGSLFGPASTTQQPQSSLFGSAPPAANTQQAAGGIFGKPANTLNTGFSGGFSGLGGQLNNNYQGNLLGIPPQQNQYQQQQQIQQSQVMNVSDNFYNLSQVWTSQMMQKLGESMLRGQMLGSGTMTLSRSNPWSRRKIKDLQSYEQFSAEAKKIEEKFQTDTENLQQVKKKLAKTTSQVIKLDDEIETAKVFIQELSKGQQCIQFQIQGLQVEINKLNAFREQLGFQIQAYQSQEGEYYNQMQLPSEFFFQMQQHHEKLLQQYEFKVREAEVLVKVVYDQARKVEQQKDGGYQIQKQSFKQMRGEIYDVCKFIYEQQKQTAFQLQQIERKSRQLKENFVMLMMKKKNYVGSFEEIDMLFEWGNTSDEPDKVYNDVMYKLKEIKNRNVTNKLVNQLQKMELIGIKDQQSSDSKQLNKALTTLFGPDTSSKKTIKEKLTKGLYTLDKSSTGTESRSTNLSSQIQMTQGVQGSPSGTQSSMLLGKRGERKLSPMDEFTYFKRTQQTMSGRQTPRGHPSQFETPSVQYNRSKRNQFYETPQDNLGGITQSVRFRGSDRNRLY